MERSRVTRYIRIAVTALSLMACVMLIALWVRSYVHGDIMSPWSGWWVASSRGELLINVWRPSNQLNSWESIGAGYVVPFWLPVALLSVAGAFPLFHWRFSLRTLLIATTLVAVGLAISVVLR